MPRTSLPFEIQNIRDQVYLKPRCLAAFGWSGGSDHRNVKGLCGSDHLLMCQDAAHGPRATDYACIEKLRFLNLAG
jgi:hypothetical protein